MKNYGSKISYMTSQFNIGLNLIIKKSTNYILENKNRSKYFRDIEENLTKMDIFLEWEEIKNDKL